jgi:hypothetical protein
VLCVPIRNEDGKVIAVTQMINKREGVFHDEDKQLLRAFAAFAEKSLSTAPTLPYAPSATGGSEQKEYAIPEKYRPTPEDREAIKSWNFDVWKYSILYKKIRFIIEKYTKRSFDNCLRLGWPCPVFYRHVRTF